MNFYKYLVLKSIEFHRGKANSKLPQVFSTIIFFKIFKITKII